MIEILVLVLILSCLLLLNKKRPKNFPPGPTPLPIIGNIHQMPKGHLWVAVEEWSKKYGQIIGLIAHHSLAIVVTGVDNIVAALRKDEFQGRPDNTALRARRFGKKLGLWSCSGEQWASSRKFVLQQFRDFGQDDKEKLISDEICRLMEVFEHGSVIQANGMFKVSAVNVIWMIIANRRIDFSDKQSREFLQNLNELYRTFNIRGELVDAFPIYRFFSKKFKHEQEIVYGIYNFIQEVIHDHKEVLDLNNPIDLIDHYLIEIERHQNTCLRPSYFSEEDLIVVASDLFYAGAESTSNSCEFVLLYVVHYPEVQKKIQEEIDNVLGRSRQPSVKDKSEMHYTMAVLSEVERINSVAANGAPHVCTKDTSFCGYYIPKNTLVLCNLRALGYDPNYWETPEVFKPERFLNAKGRYTKLYSLPTFGLGARACVAEMLVRNTIFLFTTTFLEKFSISLPPGESIPSTLAVPGITTAPPPFKISLTSRY